MNLTPPYSLAAPKEIITFVMVKQMMNPMQDDKDRVLKDTEDGTKQLCGIEERIFASGQEAGKLEIVKELIALDELPLEKISRISGFSMEKLQRVQALSNPVRGSLSLEN